MDTYDWKESQALGLSYWEALNKEGGVDGSIPYFISMLGGFSQLDVLKWENSDLIADIGCGPCGIFNHVKGGGFKYAFDSQIDGYRKKNILQVVSDVTYINLSVEDMFQSGFYNGKFNYVFSINMLDHTENPKLAIELFKLLLVSGGTLVLYTDERELGQRNSFHVGIVIYEDLLRWVSWEKGIQHGLCIGHCYRFIGRHGLQSDLIIAKKT